MKKLRLVILLILTSILTTNAQIPNSSFENWSNGSPDGWWGNNNTSFGITTILQSSEAEEGASAVKLEVASFSGIDFGPILSTGTLEHPGFPVTEKYESLNGFYKLTLAQDDYLSIAVTMSSNGSVIGEGTLDISTGASSYTPFKIDLAYIGNNVPDSCNIYFVIASQDSNSSAHSGSFALIDNLTLFNVSTSVSELIASEDYCLLQNYPNPFNPSTVISFTIEEKSSVRLCIYDVLGNEITNLLNEVKQPGNYFLNFDGSNLSSGIYYYTLRSDKFIQTKKMVLLK